jgi:hypothetical protein
MLVEYFDCLTRAEPADYFCSGGIPRSTDACNALHNRWVTCAGFAEPG